MRRRFLQRDQLRAAIIRVVDATLAARRPDIWGEGTTACAADAKKFAAWDGNLRTEWSVRHRGPGIMIYWHVERKAVCIHSQLKTVSSSEVAAMIQGVLHHCTSMEVERTYTDSHGQSEVAFAFTRLLGFELLPRLKGIHAQKLHPPTAAEADAYPRLAPVLARPIDWELIARHYDEMVKFATALHLGTVATRQTGGSSHAAHDVDFATGQLRA